MSQETNLNVSPYFDDFDSLSNYKKVLFKPGYPVQARELTGLQSILQNQIESLGNFVLKDGSRVLGGEYTYNSEVPVVVLDNEYLGESVNKFLFALKYTGARIKGRTSGVTATVKDYITNFQSSIGKYSLYLNYESSGNFEGKNITYFIDGEVLEVVDTVTDDFYGTLQPGQGFATTSSEGSFAISSCVELKSGTYYIRGYFVTVNEQLLILSQYTNTPTCRVGFEIRESIVNSFEDDSLNDNAKGFTNYTAPGADRLNIEASLTFIDIDDYSQSNFIEIFKLDDGEIINLVETTQLGELSKEFARRTYDESGHYYVKQPLVETIESLNNLKGNGGFFEEGELTYSGNVPSDRIGVYKISPAKAYVRGFEVTTGTTALDFTKPRTKKKLTNQSINYFTGPTYTLNRVFGCPDIGLSTSYTVSLRNERVGVDQAIPAGQEIGVARVYDFALESGSYDTITPDANQWDISLYDIQPYTEITLNQNITLSTPAFFKGNSSGATGYLRTSVTNSSQVTLYCCQGKFSIGESFNINGEKNNRIASAITQYTTKDVRSIYGVSGSNTLNADTVLRTQNEISYATISPAAGVPGVSTVTTSDFIFEGNVKVGDIVSYTVSGDTIKTYSKVTSVEKYSLNISAVESVSGVCNGSLPTSTVVTSDFKVLTSGLQGSSDNTLYTRMPKKFVSEVDISKSELIIRRQFSGTISAIGEFSATANSNETFLPFDEERYVLVRNGAQTEVLTKEKFAINSNQITISGLTPSLGDAQLIATLRKVDIKNRVKNRNRIKSIVIDKSRNVGSGIGGTTLNDGLTYGNYPYGTRVQDEDICLLVPDVNRVFAVIQGSSPTANPESASITFSSIDSTTNTTSDFLVGEEFYGVTSKTVGLYSERINDSKIEYVPLNNSKFISGETIRFRESGAVAVVSLIDDGDQNITSNFTFSDNQKNTIYDFSKISRKDGKKEPNRKIKIIYESSNYLTSDTGDLTSASSYNQYDFCNIKTFNGLRNTDIIDLRPRVDDYTVVEGARSPFEFDARTFTATANSATSVLASDESFRVDYDFYLPRIDKILLTKSGSIQVVQGKPAEKPGAPLESEDAITIASVYLPPYLCNIKNATIKFNEYKRYRMSDIRKLETRIENLEYYTSLNLLEQDVSSLEVKDSAGLNRFKSGFFVDNFANTFGQIKTNIVKNSIDIKESELRPSHYTTSLDFKPSYTSGISKIDKENDTSSVEGENIKFSGRVVTLDYDEVIEVSQINSTRIESVRAFSDVYYKGTLSLYPTSDVWVSQERLQATTSEFEADCSPTPEQLENCGAQIGVGAAVYNTPEFICGVSPSQSNNNSGALQNSGSNSSGDSIVPTQSEVNGTYGSNSNVLSTTDDTANSGYAPGSYTTITSSTVVNSSYVDTESLGDSIVDSKLIPYMRSRNIRFIGDTFKPNTRLYPFFDGINMNKYFIPKLLEVQMISGTFVAGENVQGFSRSDSLLADSASIRFRLANSNHKFGDIFDPDIVYITDPYNNQVLPEEYSSTSNILNIDCFSLADNSNDDYYGFISESGAGSSGFGNFVLKGETSGAEAYVQDLRLIADYAGNVIGVLHITPGSDTPSGYGPKFSCGTKPFRLTSSQTNSKVSGLVTSSGEVNFYAEGTLNTIRENIITVRIPLVETTIEKETIEVVEVETVVYVPASTPPTAPSPAASGGSSQPPQNPPQQPIVIVEPDVISPGIQYVNQGDPAIVGNGFADRIATLLNKYPQAQNLLTPGQQEAFATGNYTLDQAVKIIDKINSVQNNTIYLVNVPANYNAPPGTSSSVSPVAKNSTASSSSGVSSGGSSGGSSGSTTTPTSSSPPSSPSAATQQQKNNKRGNNIPGVSERERRAINQTLKADGIKLNRQGNIVAR